MEPPRDEPILFDVPAGWEETFARCAIELRFAQRQLQSSRYFPEFSNVFRAFDFVRPEEVRVVVLGQDPYPGVDYDGAPVATGVPFAVRRGVKLPSSLQNIYADMKQTVPGFVPPGHGDLVPWMRQGVFLLNCRLTVPARKDSAPHDFWAPVVMTVIEHIQEVNPNVVFVLWGNVAKEMTRSSLRNSVVCFPCCHPSGRNGSRFVGEGTLQAVNEEFAKRGEPLIDWSL